VQIVSEFQQKYPDVLFDVLYVPAEDLPARFAEETRNGSGRLCCSAGGMGPPLFDEGLIENLTGLVSQERLAALNQPALGGAIYDDATIACRTACKVWFSTATKISSPSARQPSTSW